MKAGSNLEKVLTSGHFAVTGELGPPRGASVEAVEKKASYLKGVVDSINVTDNQTSVVRMSSVAVCKLLVDMGLEPNLQMVCRDRNRIAMQSDLLGAYALGIRNVLCLSGDHNKFGDHPQSKNVFDVDSVQLISIVKMLRDEGKMLSGQECEGVAKFFIGAAANPFGDPFEFRVTRLAKKIDAGVDFVQTQCIYNMDKWRKYMHMAHEEGLTEKCYIMAGITPLKSVGMARYMAKFVPGLDVPDYYIERLKGVEKKKQAAEGIKIAVEQIQEMREMPGVAGIHLMAIEWEHKVPEILEAAGLLPRPKVD
ncbi:5,10-methylenetetrahydrofolate reductase (ferredoxin) [Desulfacinum hydrothermale DSM 13146]|uniref:Methylenetetrahydrofolate reductase n=1 Tax=Desulfacinum hydrothermale DSM 13146 TaxID=1121390 RepID=A0A1W1XI84_9BACT|nr:methylenetetrahydrofolate reductase [Desulfacinum hydrothermale]SMC23492.1 5,10-methylenetetrahydrofolate reductase (ferredoxin) [Desulfacinum hydrothermale DSM 13146]